MTFEPLTAERRRQQTRDCLLEAAARVFAERGFHGATLDEVAKAAGFTKGAVYSNFKNKDDLFLALLEAAGRREISAIHRTLGESDVPAQERLGDFVELIRDELAQVPVNWGSLYLEFSLYAMRNPAARERLNELEAADNAAVADILFENSPEAMTRDEALTQARLINALFRGIGLQRALGQDGDESELLGQAIEFVTRAIGVDTAPA